MSKMKVFSLTLHTGHLTVRVPGSAAASKGHSCPFDPAHLAGLCLLVRPAPYTGLPSWLRRWRTACKAGDPWFDPWLGKIPWRRDRLPTPGFLGFPRGSDVEESACTAGDLGLVFGWGRAPGEGSGCPLQDSCLENPMDTGAWRAERLTLPLLFTRSSHFAGPMFSFFFLCLNLHSTLPQALSPIVLITLY